MAYQNSSKINVTGVVSADGLGEFNGRTITGTPDFIDIENGGGISGNPTLSIAQKFEQTGMHTWNGSLLETASIVVSSDGSDIICSVELLGGGTLTAVFSDGYYDWNTSPAATVALIEGTDEIPQENFVYFLQATKTLVNSTVGFPAQEHVPICSTICQSAATLFDDGAYSLQAWTDHTTNSNNQGHIFDLNLWIRKQHATYDSGIEQTYTITPNIGVPDNVLLTTSLGKVLQLHPHVFPTFSTPTYYAINDFTSAYKKVTDLNSLLEDSTGASMSGKYFSLVIWGIVNETTSESKIFVNIPSGSYNNINSLLDDSDGFANFSVPEQYTGSGFLISQWNLRHLPSSGGSWTSISEVDLRGLLPSTAPAGSITTPTKFSDDKFRVFDDIDSTKEIAFQAENITTANTRTITMSDSDINLANVAQSSSNLTDYSVICGDGGVRGVQPVISTGTSDQVLTSNGPGALPTFQAASLGKLYIETGSTSYTLTNDEIKRDPIIYFTSTTQRTVTINFPATFDSGHTVEASQGFSQGLGDIVVDAPFQSAVLDTFRKPDFVNLLTVPTNKVRILNLSNTTCAYCVVNPNLFDDAVSSEISSYRTRYRMRIFNTGASSLDVGLDAIDIEPGWTGVSRYVLEINEEKFIPGSEAYVLQTINWSSSGGSSPEGGTIKYDWTRVSNNSKTVEITSNNNGSITFTLYKKPLLTFI